MTEHRYIEPLDIVHFRGNRLFGDPGSLGLTMGLPWPSVMAGALRSAMLATEGVDLRAFANGLIDHPELGTPTDPGTFTLEGLALARRHPDGLCETLHPWPADLALDGSQRAPGLRYLQPTVPADGLLFGGELPQIPVLAEDSGRAKPTTGHWLTAEGWRRYLAHDTLDPGVHTVPESALWRRDSRVGIGLNPHTRSVEDGKLFTSEALALAPGVGYWVSVGGATPPRSGVLRLGGDGRGASISIWHGEPPPRAPLAEIARLGRCRLVLTSPGIFPDGWRLPGDKDGRFTLGGVEGRVVAAAVARPQVISGWDLAQRQPKPAARVVPIGSVYWLEDCLASETGLQGLLTRGLWADGQADATRRAEGFNRFLFASY